MKKYKKDKNDKNDKFEKLLKNYCTGMKIMILFLWSIYIYNVYRNKYD